MAAKKLSPSPKGSGAAGKSPKEEIELKETE